MRGIVPISQGRALQWPMVVSQAFGVGHGQIWASRPPFKQDIEAAKICTRPVASRNASICKGRGLQMRKVGFEDSMFSSLQR